MLISLTCAADPPTQPRRGRAGAVTSECGGQRPDRGRVPGGAGVPAGRGQERGTEGWARRLARGRGTGALWSVCEWEPLWGLMGKEQEQGTVPRLDGFSRTPGPLLGPVIGERAARCGAGGRGRAQERGGSGRGDRWRRADSPGTGEERARESWCLGRRGGPGG